MTDEPLLDPFSLVQDQGDFDTDAPLPNRPPPEEVPAQRVPATRRIDPLEKRQMDDLNRKDANERVIEQHSNPKDEDVLELFESYSKEKGYTLEATRELFQKLKTEKFAKDSKNTTDALADGMGGDAPNIIGQIKKDTTAEQYKKMGWFGLMGTAFKQGVQNIINADDAYDVVKMLKENPNPKLRTATQKAQLSQSIRSLNKRAKHQRLFQEAVQEYWAEDVEEQKDAIGALNKAWKKKGIPTSEILKVLGSKLSSGKTLADLLQSAPTMGGSVLPVIGSFFGPVGTAIGVGGSYLFSYDVEQESRLMELMERNGVNWEDYNSVQSALDDPRLIDELISESRKYGAIIGGVESATGLAGGKIAQFGKAAVKKSQRAGLRQAMSKLGSHPVVTLPAKTVAGGVAEGVGEATGEAAALAGTGHTEEITTESIVDNFILGGLLGGGVQGFVDVAQHIIDNNQVPGPASVVQSSTTQDSGDSKTGSKEEPLPETKPLETTPEEETVAPTDEETEADLEVEEDFAPGPEDVERTETEALPETETLPETEETPPLPETIPELVEEVQEASETVNTISNVIRYVRMLGLSGVSFAETGEKLDEFQKGARREILKTIKEFVKIDSVLTPERIINTLETKNAKEIVNLELSNGRTFGQEVETLQNVQRRLEEVIAQEVESRKKLIPRRKAQASAAIEGHEKLNKKQKEIALKGYEWKDRMVKSIENLTGIPLFGEVSEGVSMAGGDRVYSIEEGVSSVMGGDVAGYFRPHESRVATSKHLSVRGIVHEFAHVVTSSVFFAGVALQDIKKRGVKLGKAQESFLKHFEKLVEVTGAKTPRYHIDVHTIRGSMRNQKGGFRSSAFVSSIEDYLSQPTEIISRMVEVLVGADTGEAPTTFKGNKSWGFTEYLLSWMEFEGAVLSEETGEVSPVFFLEVPNREGLTYKVPFRRKKESSGSYQYIPVEPEGITEENTPTVRWTGRLVPEVEELIRGLYQIDFKEVLGPTDFAILAPEKTKAVREGVKAMLEQYAKAQAKRESKEYQSILASTKKTAREYLEKLHPVFTFLQSIEGVYRLAPESARKELGEFKGIPAAIPRSLNKLKGNQTVTIEQLAALYGKDTLSFIKELRKAPPWDKEINRLSRQLADDVMGIDSVSFSETVLTEGLGRSFDKARKTQIKNELDFLAKKMKSVYKDTLQDIAGKLPTLEAIVQAAHDSFAGLSLRDTSPTKLHRKEHKFAKLAAKALRAGKVDMAYQYKVEEAKAFEMWKLATRFHKFREQSVNKLKKYSKYSITSDTRDKSIISAMKSMLNIMGVAKGKDRRVIAHLSGLKKYNKVAYDSLIEKMKETVENVNKYEGGVQSVKGFVSFMDVVNQLWGLAREAQLDSKGREIERQAREKAELLRNLKKVSSAKPPQSAISKLTRAYFNGIRVGGSLLRTLDKKVGSTFLTDNVVNPILQGEKNYEKNLSGSIESITNFFKNNYTKADKKALQKPVDAHELGFVFKSKSLLLGALLHTGNEQNLKRLIVGYGWGEITEGVLNDSKWKAFVERAKREGILTERDFAFVERVWEVIGSKLKDAQKTHHHLFGSYFEEVPGKYYPAIKAKGARIEAPDNIDSLLEGEGINQILPTTSRSFTKQRAGFSNDPLELDPSYILTHLRKVQRFIDIQPAVSDAYKLLRRTEVRAELERVNPNAWQEIISPWLSDVVNQRRFERGNPIIDSAFLLARKFAAAKIMFLNIANSAIQFTGLSVSAPFVGKANLLRNSVRLDRIFLPTNVEAIHKLSPTMKDRATSHAYEMERMVRETLEGPSTIDKALSYTYVLQSWTQSIVDRITWLAAIDKFMDEKPDGNPVMAAQWADDIVERTQSGTSVARLSAAEKGSRFAQLFTMFSRYMVTNHNLLAEEWSAAGAGEKPSLIRRAELYSFVALIPAIVMTAVYKSLYMDDDEEPEEALMEGAVDIGLGVTLGRIPILGGELQEGAKRLILPEGGLQRPWQAPVQQMAGEFGKAFQEAAKAAGDDGDPDKLADRLLKALLPKQVYRTGSGVLRGEGPRDLLKGVPYKQ